MVKARYKNHLIEKIKVFCRAQYKLLPSEDFKLGEGHFNRKCHMNTVQKIYEKKAVKVHLVVIFSSTIDPIVHFINEDENGEFVDNTIGWEWEFYNYYYIKEVSKSEFDGIGYLLTDTKEMLFDQVSNKFLSMLFGINSDIV